MSKVKTDLRQVLTEWQHFLDLIKVSGKVKWTLEVGTFRGKGTIGLCAVSNQVITIDMDDRRVSKPPGSVFIKANTQEDSTLDKVKQILNGDQLNALFIDAGHKYEDVKRDFELYSTIVAPGGIIGFHDIADCERHRLKHCNVFKFWNEIKDDYKNEEIIHDGTWAGIGVIWKKIV